MSAGESIDQLAEFTENDEPGEACGRTPRQDGLTHAIVADAADAVAEEAGLLPLDRVRVRLLFVKYAAEHGWVIRKRSGDDEQDGG